MPRGSNGVYTPPAGTTPVPNTLGDATKMATYLADLGNEITGSLPTNGSAPMTGPLTLSGNATSPLNPVTLQQVQTGGVVQQGGLSTGAPRWTPEGLTSVQRLNIGGVYHGRSSYFNSGNALVADVGSAVGTGFGDTYGINIAVPTGNYWFGVNGARRFEIDAFGDVTIAQKLTTGITGAGSGLAIKPGTDNHCFVEFYARTADPNTRSSYVGYESPGSGNFVINNGLGIISFQLASVQKAFINENGIGGNGSQITGINFGAGIANVSDQGVGTYIVKNNSNIAANTNYTNGGSISLPGGTWRCTYTSAANFGNGVNLNIATLKRIA